MSSSVRCGYAPARSSVIGRSRTAMSRGPRRARAAPGSPPTQASVTPESIGRGAPGTSGHHGATATRSSAVLPRWTELVRGHGRATSAGATGRRRVGRRARTGWRRCACTGPRGPGTCTRRGGRTRPAAARAHRRRRTPPRLGRYLAGEEAGGELQPGFDLVLDGVPLAVGELGEVDAHRIRRRSRPLDPCGDPAGFDVERSELPLTGVAPSALPSASRGRRSRGARRVGSTTRCRPSCRAVCGWRSRPRSGVVWRSGTDATGRPTCCVAAARQPSSPEAS